VFDLRAARSRGQANLTHDAPHLEFLVATPRDNTGLEITGNDPLVDIPMLGRLSPDVRNLQPIRAVQVLRNRRLRPYTEDQV